MNIKEKDVIVIKADGSTEPWNPDKIYKHLKEACKGTKISPSQVMMDLNINLQKRMKSSDIQEILIKTVADQIDAYGEKIDNEKVAARLLNEKIRKIVYKQYNPKDFVQEVKNRVKKKYYDENILNIYTEEELQKLGKIIKYEKDDNFSYMGMLQMHRKYLIRDKNKQNIETPQEANVLIPSYIFANENNRFEYIKDMYNGLSEFKILLSTPIASGVRTPLRMYSSCAGINIADTQEGIARSFEDIYILTLNRAGIGETPGHIRGVGADIDNGREKHTGITPIVKVAEKISLSAMQPGTGRGGAITNYYPFFHWEIELILELKNNKGTDDNRVRQSDHAIIFNDLFYERLYNDEDITLFYMNDVGNLYEHIGDTEYFKKKYTELENKRGIKKKKIKASFIYKKFWNERIATGRYYKANADEFQSHSAFKIPVYFSNLCTEINLPSHMYGDFKVKIKKGYKGAMHTLFDDLVEAGEWYYLYEHFFYNEPLPETELYKTYKSFLAKPKDLRNKNYDVYTFNFYEIFVCILAGLNLGKMESYDEMVKYSALLVRFLDNLIDYQEYPIDAMKKGAIGRRALGISVSGLFHYLAKKDLDYKTEEARNEIHRVMEAIYYGAITESIKLAKEKGICKYYKDTKYSDGLLTIDTYNKNVDELVQVDYMYNWDKVREDLKKYGLRNSTLLTMVPASNSARTAGTISGIEPPQDLVTIIEDKKIFDKMLLPDVEKYRDFYIKNNVWNIDTVEYFKFIAVMQKFIDQAISLNQYNSYLKYQDEKIPFDVLSKQDLTALKYGIKTLYYSKTQSDDESKNHLDKKHNYDKQPKVDKFEDTCSGGACSL